MGKYKRCTVGFNFPTPYQLLSLASLFVRVRLSFSAHRLLFLSLSHTLSLSISLLLSIVMNAHASSILLAVN
jgi:hypothetical protein